MKFKAIANGLKHLNTPFSKADAQLYWTDAAELLGVPSKEDTLTVQKRMGLDKLFPSLSEDREKNKGEKEKEEALKRVLTPLEKARQRQVKRNTDANQELFEAEMERLFDPDAADIRRCDALVDDPDIQHPSSPTYSSSDADVVTGTKGKTKPCISKKDVDVEADLHGLTAEQMRVTLQQQWAQWQGKQVVRIIHGQGAVLRPEVERWCQEMGIPVSFDPGNPGALKIYPRERHAPGSQPNTTFGTTLRDRGLRLTPEQEAQLRHPQAMERLRREEQQKREQAIRKKRDEETARRAQQKRHADLWLTEMARLDKTETKRTSAVPQSKSWFVGISPELNRHYRKVCG